ncbi:MAG: GatB/YqeY domain-containing protein [Hyphomicrobiaceae bacterium]|nr:GatB/YqeY domain-containing protein [Hyphomicrobiaceae bacterium]
MREKIGDALNKAVDEEDRRGACTLRLIHAAIKDRDSEARAQGKERVGDDEIVDILARMIRQRETSVTTYEQDGQIELADQEREEMEIIRTLLPMPLPQKEMEAACAEAISAVGASGLRDVGRTMAALKARYPGRIDYTKATAVVRDLLR